MSTRISKTLAEQLANVILVETKTNKISAAIKLSDTIKPLYLNSLPEKILTAFKDPVASNYLTKSNYIQLYGDGFNHEYFYFYLNNQSTITEFGKLKKQSLPFYHDSKLNFINSLTKEERTNVLNLNNELVKATKIEKNLKQELIATLVSLGTPKRVGDIFPEVREMLELAKPITTLAIPTEELRSKFGLNSITI